MAKQDDLQALAESQDMLADERVSSRRLLTKVLNVSLGLNVGMFCALVWLAQPHTEFQVLEKTGDGQLRYVASSSTAYATVQEVKDFARRRFLNIHRWTHKNYIQVFEDERSFWDEEPLSRYINARIDGGLFDEAKRYLRRYDAELVAPIKLVQQMQYDGDYRIYRVEMLLQDESVDVREVGRVRWKAVMDVREVRPGAGRSALKVMRFDEVAEK